MKKSILLPLLLILSATSFSQQTKPSVDLTKQDYLQKSKNQKKAALIMLGGGTGLLLTGIVIPKGEQTGSSGYLGIPFTELPDYKNDGIKAAFGVTGFLSMLGSIPFFIASGKNNRKAMNVSFKNETAPLLLKNSFVYRSVPSVNIKISL